MIKGRYAISWLYGEFRIARFRKGEVVESWASPELVESKEDLADALREAANNITFTNAGDVTIVHEHDLHTHDYLEVPAMKRRDLERYLKRRVDQDKTFDEPAQWCYHTVAHRDGKSGVLLHLLPAHLVSSTVNTLDAVGLATRNYVPLTEIVSDMLPKLGVDDDVMVVVVACFKQRTELVVALGDGDALFVRELNYGLADETLDRGLTDVNRTLRYARQQLGRQASELLVMGPLDESLQALMTDGTDIPVRFVEHTDEPEFWAKQAMALSGKLSANYLSSFANRGLTTDVVRRGAGFATVAVVSLAVVTTIVTSGLVAHRAEEINEIEMANADVLTDIDMAERALNYAREKQDHLEKLREATQNIPTDLLSDLSRMLPSGTALKRVSVERGEAGWVILLQGEVYGDLRAGARTLAQFEHTLAQAPWHMNVTQSFRDSWMQQFGQGKLSNATGFSIEAQM